MSMRHHADWLLLSMRHYAGQGLAYKRQHTLFEYVPPYVTMRFDK